MISWAHVHAEFRAKALMELPGAASSPSHDETEARGVAAAQAFGVDQLSSIGGELAGRRDDVDVVMGAFREFAPCRSGDRRGGTADSSARSRSNQGGGRRREMVAAVEKAGVEGRRAFVSRFSRRRAAPRRSSTLAILGTIISRAEFHRPCRHSRDRRPPGMADWMEDATLAAAAPGSTKARTPSIFFVG